MCFFLSHCWSKVLCRLLCRMTQWWTIFLPIFSCGTTQHLGICGGNGNPSVLNEKKKNFKFTHSPSFIHALFMPTSVSISYLVSSSQSSTLIITLTFSLPFGVLALYTLISPPDGLSFLSAIWPLFSLPFCHLLFV